MFPMWRVPPNGIERSSAWRSKCSIRATARPRRADKVEWFTADHETAGSDDLCFLTEATPDQVVAPLKASGVPIVEGPVQKQGARGMLRSVYCRDPDGSLIEISSYEEDP